MAPTKKHKPQGNPDAIRAARKTLQGLGEQNGMYGRGLARGLAIVSGKLPKQSGSKK